MEAVQKTSRTVSNGIYKTIWAVARGARRVLSVVPFLGITEAAENDDDAYPTTVHVYTYIFNNSMINHLQRVVAQMYFFIYIG